jgi:DNA recombination protein RmuC
LGVVKGEFGKYSEVLGKVKEKLEQASKQIDAAEVRTRQIHRKLKSVEGEAAETAMRGESKALGAGELFEDYG